ncbi:carboxymuconolactone decarboxylase family protein [Sulfitobacter sp. D35]|uniref:carboxymuconolactone decarboxylase family protein n=1 Tax=Sulfitobacter sp. D35 TaxID=3083252 RepID=UPI00296FB6F0|nr:carboxymuconolactone decarboxylase family protein [Sulfitobacter sp. D35]MDW4500005.1 carboxymuconolactone decarboxylase family protein [Sulfitobacter sp. D35]
MTEFTLHTAQTAPEASKPLLAKSEAAFGMIPSLHAVMAESPQMLEGYQQLHKLFQETHFNPEELTVVWQTINVENNCHYCVPAHTGIAKSMKVDDAIIDALRDGTPLPDAKLEALRDFTLKIVRDRGVVDDAAVQAFLDAGFTRRSVLDVILGYAQKIMSNYTNHFAETPVDKPFQKFAWDPAATKAA